MSIPARTSVVRVPDPLESGTRMDVIFVSPEPVWNPVVRLVLGVVERSRSTLRESDPPIWTSDERYKGDGLATCLCRFVGETAYYLLGDASDA